VSYVSEVLADGPSVLLKLDDATTTFIDSSGNGHTQTSSGTLTANQAGFTSEITVSALFGGGKVTEDFGSATAYTAVTVEVWYKSTNGNGVLWTSRGAAGNGLTLFIGVTGAGFGSAGQISWGLDGALYQGVNTSATFHDGNIHHIVGVFSRASGTIAPSDFQIYVDGILQTVTQRAINGSATVPFTPSTNWLIGQHPAGWANGTLTSTNLAMASLYPTALSAQRIYAHFSASGMTRASSVASRESVAVLAGSTTVSRLSSRLSAVVLVNDTTVKRFNSRQSAIVLNNEQVIRRTLSRTSVQVLVRMQPRFEGWGVAL
jgi:hypothetical protein